MDFFFASKLFEKGPQRNLFFLRKKENLLAQTGKNLLDRLDWLEKPCYDAVEMAV